MILKNAKYYANGLIHKGALLINNGIIEQLKFNPNEEDFRILTEKNEDGREIDCGNKLIIPGIIDIHSHLRDLGQSEKETFETGTKAAAFSGITTVFDMPNTTPPAITADQVKIWMEKAIDNIYVNVGFIAGVPKDIDDVEMKKIMELGVVGFKIYPLKSLNGMNWSIPDNIQKLMYYSSKYQIPIFIHPDVNIESDKWDAICDEWSRNEYNVLELHNKLYPPMMEEAFVNTIYHSYLEFIDFNDLAVENYPIVHLCHISNRLSYNCIKKYLDSMPQLKISFEITPHHLLLSNKIKLTSQNYGKVLPPLKDKEHPKFLFEEFKKGNIELIGTDHAPHTLEEKSEDFLKAPSGFPGFETYPLVLLDKVSRYILSLENFVKAASENPAKRFNLKNKGFIKEGYDADLLIVDKVSEYPIDSQKFKTKAKFSPFENYLTTIQIWKVFLKGTEINRENSIPIGEIIKRSS